MPSEDALGVEAKGGEDKNPNWNKESDFEDKAREVGFKEVGASVKMGAEVVSEKEGESDGKNVTQG